MKISQQVSLQAYNTMAVPALADYMVEIDSVEQLKEALEFAKHNSLPSLVLGEGSNSVFRDDYHGLIILNRMMGIETIHETDSHIQLKVSAGENWHKLVERCTKSGWYGLQNLALIPGLVGAAPIQNIGAYGVELSNVLAWVEYFDFESGDLQQLDNSDCGFDYRESRFKHDLSDRVMITAISLVLSKQPKVNIAYPALSALLDEGATPEDVYRVVCEIRGAKLPSPSLIPNSGSFFKNPVVSSAEHAELKRRYPDLVSFAVGESYKLAAAWMIEFAGWKQREIEGVRVHQAQALVVINPKHRSGSAVLNFVHAVQADIKEVFGVELEIEPRIHG